MIWNDLEKSFINAWALSFSKDRLIFCSISLILCGVLFVFCRALSSGSGSWIHVSLAFMPILLSMGLLLSSGVILVRMYIREMGGLTLNLKKILAGVLEIAIGSSYLSFPPVFAFLCLWIVLGFFLLLKEIPLIGPFFSVILAFGPFLLIFCSLLLCVLGVAVLFFVVPAVAHRSLKRLELWADVWRMLKKRPFQAAFLFALGLIPACLMAVLLTLAASIANYSFASNGPSAFLALEWFFMMIPFCALLTPPIIFFFNFAAESYLLLRR
jgi:hypothetical protein